MAVVAEPPPAQPEGPHHPKGDQPARRALASQTPHYSSLARTALRRHQPEVGAGCPNGARPVLCGGCTVMRIPTATSTRDVDAAHSFTRSCVGMTVIRPTGSREPLLCRRRY